MVLATGAMGRGTRVIAAPAAIPSMGTKNLRRFPRKVRHANRVNMGNRGVAGAQY